MLEMLYGFAGLGFGWVVLGLILLLPAVNIERWVQGYVSWSTKDNIKMPRPFQTFWRKWFAPDWHKHAPTDDNYYHYDMSVMRRAEYGWMVYAFYIITYFVSTFIWLFNSYKIDGKCYQEFAPSIQEAINGFFGVYVPIGAWLAPALLLIAVVFAPTWLSRKVFTMADAFTKHVSDKDAHKEK